MHRSAEQRAIFVLLETQQELLALRQANQLLTVLAVQRVQVVLFAQKVFHQHFVNLATIQLLVQNHALLLWLAPTQVAMEQRLLQRQRHPLAIGLWRVQ